MELWNFDLLWKNYDTMGKNYDTILHGNRGTSIYEGNKMAYYQKL